MKKLFLFFLALSLPARAQFYQDDRVADQPSIQSLAAVSFRFVSPLEYFDLKCAAPKYATFSNGTSGFAAVFKKSVNEMMNSGLYAPEGPFSFVFTVEKDGALSHVEVLPKVKNAQYLAEDIAAVLKKNMPAIQPAACSGSAVASKFRIKINFDSETADDE